MFSAEAYLNVDSDKSILLHRCGDLHHFSRTVSPADRQFARELLKFDGAECGRTCQNLFQIYKDRVAYERKQGQTYGSPEVGFVEEMLDMCFRHPYGVLVIQAHD